MAAEPNIKATGFFSRSAYTACKADWIGARRAYPQTRQRGDDLLLELFNATNRFFRSSDARKAFRGGWTAEELFGITLETPRRLGAVCAAVYANLAIVHFDGAWVFVDAPSIAGEDAGDSLHRYIRTDFQYRGSVPWWHHPTYARNRRLTTKTLSR